VLVRRVGPPVVGGEVVVLLVLVHVVKLESIP
jgi:hypothetical protein